MKPLVQRDDRHTWNAPAQTSESTTFDRDCMSEPEFDSWDQTDQPLRFRAPMREFGMTRERSNALTGESNPVRSQWLAEHDIHTEFLDAGIGCCWFAQHGDDEPVAGETEDEAIERLTHENRFPWRSH